MLLSEQVLIKYNFFLFLNADGHINGQEGSVLYQGDGLSRAQRLKNARTFRQKQLREYYEFEKREEQERGSLKRYPPSQNRKGRNVLFNQSLLLQDAVERSDVTEGTVECNTVKIFVGQQATCVGQGLRIPDPSPPLPPKKVPTYIYLLLKICGKLTFWVCRIFTFLHLQSNILVLTKSYAVVFVT